MKAKVLLTLFIILITVNVSVFGQPDPLRQWPSYRGYLSSGVLDKAGLPETFSLMQNQNIRWITEVPGLGLSSPVIWKDKIFITTAVSKADTSGIKTGLYGDVTSVNDSSVHDWKVLCYDKGTGRLLWERIACTGIPKIKRHPKSTHANASVSTDGNFIVAFFGSEGLYCYDSDGNLQWQKNFGTLESAFFMQHDAQWEFASSPVIYGAKVIIQCDVLENSFIAAYDIKSGKEIWETKRDDYPAWSTPNIYSYGGKEFIVVNGYKHMGGYDLENGKEVWRMSGGGDIPIPTPVVGKDLIYLNGAHGKLSPVIAVSKNATGDITLLNNETSNQYVKWSRPRGGSYMHSLLFYNDRLYNLNWNGSLQCLDPITGSEIFTGKLGKSISFVASMVASDGKIYVVDEEGTVYILKDGDRLDLVEEIPLNDKCLTAPALTDGMIIFRTRRYLIAAGKN